MRIPCGNTHVVEDLPMDNFTDFQLARIDEIVKGPTFDFACVPEGYGEGHTRGPIVFMWYNTDGSLCYERMGVQRTLRSLTK